MQGFLCEITKHRTFREVWIAYGIAAVFLVLFLSTTESISDPRLRWWFVQQDIYTYGATLTALLITVGLPRLICYEWERKMIGLICTANQGRLVTWRSKALFSVLYCALVVMLIGLCSIFVHCSTFSFQGAFEPVSSCVYFKTSDLPPMCNLGYCALQYGFLFLGALYFAGFILLISIITRHTMRTIVIGGLSFLLCMIYEYRGDVFPGWINIVLGNVFRFCFGGFLFQNSFSWSLPNLQGDWSDVWKGVCFAVAAIVAEYSVLWFLWRRKGRA